MKQNTMTKKQMNQGWNAIVKETHTLNQVLKSFGGLMSQKLPELDGLTVGQFLTANGIEVAKGKVGVSSIRKAWHPGMLVDGALAVFRSVPVLWAPAEGDDLWHKDGRAFRACTKEEAQKYVETGEYTPLTVHTLVPVEQYKWDTKVIANAMKQKSAFEKHNTRAKECAEMWENLTELYIVYDVETSKGVFERRMRRINKAEATF